MSGNADDLVWDTSDTVIQLYDIATASSSGDTVVLGFGAREADEYQVQAFTARLLRRIALRPESAQHLREMLGRALDTKAGARGPNG